MVVSAIACLAVSAPAQLSETIGREVAGSAPYIPAVAVDLQPEIVKRPAGADRADHHVGALVIGDEHDPPGPALIAH